MMLKEDEFDRFNINGIMNLKIIKKYQNLKIYKN